MKGLMVIRDSASRAFLLVMATALSTVHAQNQTPANVAPPAPAVTWTDPKTRLMWPLTDNAADVTQPQALGYCRNLSLGGFKDWRLPEIDELAGLYGPSVVSGSYEWKGSRYDLHVKGGIQITSCCVSSATRGDRSGEALFFSFVYGLRGSNDNGLRALCVRRAGE
jgi:hypothetical protein